MSKRTSHSPDVWNKCSLCVDRAGGLPKDKEIPCASLDSILRLFLIPRWLSRLQRKPRFQSGMEGKAVTLPSLFFVEKIYITISAVYNVYRRTGSVLLPCQLPCRLPSVPVQMNRKWVSKWQPVVSCHRCWKQLEVQYAMELYCMDEQPSLIPFCIVCLGRCLMCRTSVMRLGSLWFPGLFSSFSEVKTKRLFGWFFVL